MQISEMPDDMRADIERRIKKGHGEIVTISWTDLDEKGEPVTVAGDYYIGKMNLGQTGTIIAVLAAMFSDGIDLKTNFGMTSNVAFINAIKPQNLAVLVSTIVGEEIEWVDENFDISWVIDVLVRFLKHNDFFKVIQQVTSLLERNGITETSAREMLTTSPLKKKSKAI